MATAKEKYNICLDVGGTKVLGAIFNEQDKIIYRLKKRSKSAGSASTDVEKVIVDVVEEMIKESGIDRAKLNAVASCAPGVIDQEKGIVLFTPNLPWRDYDMAGSMSKKFGVPFFVGNDVNLGVLGEYHFGAAQGYKNIVGFFVGTGIRPYGARSGRPAVQLRPARLPGGLLQQTGYECLYPSADQPRTGKPDG